MATSSLASCALLEIGESTTMSEMSCEAKFRSLMIYCPQLCVSIYHFALLPNHRKKLSDVEGTTPFYLQLSIDLHPWVVLEMLIRCNQDDGLQMQPLAATLSTPPRLHCYLTSYKDSPCSDVPDGSQTTTCRPRLGAWPPVQPAAPSHH